MYIEINGERTFYSGSGGNGKDDDMADQASVLFVHGAGMDHTVWTLPARHFARLGYRVIVPDLPAHGRSAGTPLASIAAMAGWLRDLLDALNIEKVAMVGHSMGSMAALTFAASFPERTRSLALLGSSAPMPVTDLLLDAARANDHDAIDMANIWSHSTFGLQGGNANPGINMTMSGQRLLERAANGVFFTDLNACNDFTNGATLATAITVPTLVIAGDEDKMTPAPRGAEIAGLIDQARLVRLACCGHSMLSERPNEVLDALKDIC